MKGNQFHNFVKRNEKNDVYGGHQMFKYNKTATATVPHSPQKERQSKNYSPMSNQFSNGLNIPSQTRRSINPRDLTKALTLVKAAKDTDPFESEFTGRVLMDSQINSSQVNQFSNIKPTELTICSGSNRGESIQKMQRRRTMQKSIEMSLNRSKKYKMEKFLYE